MTPAERRRQHILAILVRDLPRAFWEDLRGRVRQAYLDIFHQVRNDPNVLDEQRLDKLYQDRHFRMENLLKVVSDAYGLDSSAALLVENNRRYVFASMGAVGLTQAYVQTIGEMPKPARFRERHSELNRIVREPALNFGLEPPALVELKAFYGVIAHNPVGKRFTETDQALGMIQLCVPIDGCTSWASQFTLQEIISAYAIEEPTPKPERGPSWKRDEEGKEEGER